MSRTAEDHNRRMLRARDTTDRDDAPSIAQLTS
jgi:hypothetical protein